MANAGRVESGTRFCKNKRELNHSSSLKYMSLRTYTPISKNIISQLLKKCNC